MAEQQDAPWAEIVAAYGQMMIVRHDADRMVMMPRYADRDDTADEDDRSPADTQGDTRGW